MNVKAGELAVVRSPDICPEIHDSIVEVLSYFGDLLDYGPAWNCTCPSMREAGFSSLPIADSMLRPISGVPVHDEQRDEVPA